MKPTPPKKIYMLTGSDEDAIVYCDTLEEAKLEAVGPVFRDYVIYEYMRSARSPIHAPKKEGQ